MARYKNYYVVFKRKDSKYYYITINTTSGLPDKVCREWKRKSFQNFPPELGAYANPKSMTAARNGADALLNFLRNADKKPLKKDNIRVGEWLEKFTSIEESPKGARLNGKNRPYSVATIARYKDLYGTHMKGDPFMELPMLETESQEALAFMNRMALRRMVGGQYKYLDEKPQLVGTETYAKLIKFIRMAFKEYGRDNLDWHNPFSNIDPPVESEYPERDSLDEFEVLKLFAPGVLTDNMELAICAAMYWAGMRIAEICALKPEDLDWSEKTPKITICRAWQLFLSKNGRVLDKTKSKRSRVVPFDDILQKAIKKLWDENGRGEFVFMYKKDKEGNYRDGRNIISKTGIPGASWIRRRMKKWFERAGIELNGRNITPHSSRHSLAAILEDHDVSLRYIQELLGHRSLKTTKKHYLRSMGKKIRDIGEKIAEVQEQAQNPVEEKSNVIPMHKAG